MRSCTMKMLASIIEQNATSHQNIEIAIGVPIRKEKFENVTAGTPTEQHRQNTNMIKKRSAAKKHVIILRTIITAKTARRSRG